MHFKPIMLCACAAATVAVLSGCADNNSLRSRLGLLHQGPDQFAVIPNEPIEIPEGDELPLPQPGTPARVRSDPVAVAAAALGVEVQPATEPSPSEVELLETLGATNPNPLIAIELQDEAAAAAADDDTPLVHRWLGVAANRERQANQLDPVAETERLRAAGIIAPPPVLADDGDADGEDN